MLARWAAATPSWVFVVGAPLIALFDAFVLVSLYYHFRGKVPTSERKTTAVLVAAVVICVLKWAGWLIAAKTAPGSPR